MFSKFTTWVNFQLGPGFQARFLKYITVGGLRAVLARGSSSCTITDVYMSEEMIGDRSHHKTDVVPDLTSLDTITWIQFGAMNLL